MSSISIASVLMREALTLLDEPDVVLIAQHLRVAIDAAEEALARGR